MNQHKRHFIESLGRNLDQCIFPEVLDGGVLQPGTRSVVPSLPGESTNRDTETKPSTASGTPRHTCSRQSARSPGAPCYPASVPCANTLSQFADLEGNIATLMRSYPGTQSLPLGHGVWLQVPCAVMPGLGFEALFVIFIQPTLRQVVAWGFWKAGTIGLRWIGPRHTNYGDGSICAFDLRDDTWRFGDPLTRLMDIYTVWAFRHLHLETTGRWPGPQASVRAIERLTEMRSDELCGCDVPKGRYEHCCHPKDLAKPFERCPVTQAQRKSSYLAFEYAMERLTRQPPLEAISLARGKL